MFSDIPSHETSSHPTGMVYLLSVSELRRRDIDTGRLRSKSWDEFATPNTTPIDLTITVPYDASGEIFPIWPSTPICASFAVGGAYHQRQP